MRWNLDQLQAFVTTVQTGSFSSAARKLKKAQSGVSTAIANLETDIGFDLFNRDQRYPTLTEKGQSLYPQAKQLLQQCLQLDSRINTLVNNEESVLTLAVDEVFPEQALEQTLFNTQQNFPHLRLTLINGSQGDIIDYVTNKQADLGLIVQSNPISNDVYALDIGHLNYLMVCAHEHPLAQQQEVSIYDLQQYRQFVNCNKQGEAHSAPISADIWLFDSYFYIVPLVIQGAGWAIIPQSIAQHDLFKSNFYQLQVKEFNVLEASTISIIKRREAPDSSASDWLINFLQNQFSQPT